MIRFLSCPDIHFSPAWLDVMATVFGEIKKQAIAHNVDFIAFPGDLHDHALIAGNSSGFNILADYIADLLKVCPIVAIEGTPSHDTPGAYANLEKLGLVLLRPGKAYGYMAAEKLIADIHGNESEPWLFNAILFGVPELRKDQILATNLGLSSDQAAAMASQLLADYVTEFLSPMRAKFANIPAIGLLHGAVSSSRRENIDDLAKKSAGIIIHTEDLKPAHLDYWCLGDQHLPEVFADLPGSYAGSWGLYWGEQDFLPAMELVEIIRDETAPPNTIHYRVNRLPYGTPERRKIYAPLPVYDPNIAYWLDTENQDDQVPTGHPWSKITFRENRQESRRISQEQYTTDLPSLIRLNDPEATDAIIEKSRQILVEVPPVRIDPIDARLSIVRIWGAKDFWMQHGAKSCGLRLDALPDGLTLINGQNGDGKSALLSFCHWYPVMIGKLPKSGRRSAIHEFFDAQDSGIEKIGVVNGVEHRHLIQIKSAHTANPAVECYLFIAGENQMVTKKFDEMFELCEKLYGSFDDYLLTTFYEQPGQSDRAPESLIWSGPAKAEDLVQSIVGIDREREKRFCLDEVQRVSREIDHKEAFIAGMSMGLMNTDEILIQIADEEIDLKTQQELLATIIDQGKQASDQVGQLEAKKLAMDAENQRRAQNEQRQAMLERQMVDKQNQIKNLSQAVVNLESNRKTLAKINAYDAWAETKAKANSAHALAVSEIQAANNRIMAAEQAALTRIENAKKTIALLSIACPQCGFIDPENIRKIEEQQAVVNAPLESFVLKALPMPPLINPEPDYVFADRVVIQTAIDQALSAEGTIEVLKHNIAEYHFELNHLIGETYNIDPAIVGQLNDAKTERQRLLDEYQAVQTKIITMESRIKTWQDQITKQRETEAQITGLQLELTTLTADLADWKYLSAAMPKIAAMELDLALDSIDAEATRIIEPFLDGRYRFRTVTQKSGKQGTVDKFDILIYDAELGFERSFFSKNPGHKAPFADAYTKALIRARNERMHRIYSPIVLDEADAPISPSRIPMYYGMQTKFFMGEGLKTLVVSQKTDTVNFVQNKVNIKELVK